MSAPRYTVTLKIGESRITRKCKTILGDYEGLAKELEEWDMARLAMDLSKINGGEDRLRELWLENSRRWLKDE